MAHFKVISKLLVCALCACMIFSIPCSAESYGDNEIVDDFAVISGDVNGDEIVDICDMVRLNQYLAGKVEDSELNLANANVEIDDVIDSSDLVALRNFLLTF